MVGIDDAPHAAEHAPCSAVGVLTAPTSFTLGPCFIQHLGPLDSKLLRFGPQLHGGRVLAQLNDDHSLVLYCAAHDPMDVEDTFDFSLRVVGEVLQVVPAG